MFSRTEPPAIDSVLVVDDSATQRRIAVALCRDLGVRTAHEAGNGQEALALLAALPVSPALLIIDLEMPTMDGLELLGALRERKIEAPIIVASSCELALVHSVENLARTLGLRILGAVQKPLTAERLAGLLRGDVGPRTGVKIAASDPIDPDALRTAIERSELAVHYQPQIDIDTGYVRGVEALARWQHPTLGNVSPDRFIPVAEQHGLIQQLTLQVMNRALFQEALWRAQGMELRLAVNLSPVLLDHLELVEEISGLLRCHGIEPNRVILEITESSLLRDLAVALSVLTRLRLRGFGLSLDDYGTGFSSMQQLARIPFTELKIDRAFVHGAHEQESLRVMLRSALDLAGQLKIDAVAEGVESMEDWRLLREFGCTYAQGWLLAEPMPAEKFEDWLKEHLARRPALLEKGHPSPSEDQSIADTAPYRTLRESAPSEPDPESRTRTDHDPYDTADARKMRRPKRRRTLDDMRALSEQIKAARPRAPKEPER